VICEIIQAPTRAEAGQAMECFTRTTAPKYPLRRAASLTCRASAAVRVQATRRW
jgi:hypothetical protein